MKRPLLATEKDKSRKTVERTGHFEERAINIKHIPTRTSEQIREKLNMNHHKINSFPVKLSRPYFTAPLMLNTLDGQQSKCLNSYQAE